jgi:DNA-binding IclR family transcriptional regulator
MANQTREIKSRGGIQVIERAAAILRVLDGEPQGLSLADIASRVGLARSTVHRIVVALSAEGFVTPASPTRRVRLGPLLVRLAAASERDLAAELRPLLHSLSKEVRETVNLSVLEHDKALIIAQVVGPEMLTVAGDVGETLPLHATSLGLVLLSTLSDDVIRRLLPPVLERFTEQTITDREVLLAEVGEVRTTGISMCREVYLPGLCSVAALVTKNVSRPVAISIPAPSHRFYGQEEHLVRALLRLREQIERRHEPEVEKQAEDEDEVDEYDGQEPLEASAVELTPSTSRLEGEA